MIDVFRHCSVRSHREIREIRETIRREGAESPTPRAEVRHELKLPDLLDLPVNRDRWQLK